MINMDSVKIIFLAIMVIAYLEIPTVLATGSEDLVAEFSSREDVVRWGGYGEDSLSTVVIGGKLLCHDREVRSKQTPVSGASVAVFCGSSGNRKKSWARGSTNSYGEFLIDLPSYLHAIPNLEKVCLVKVLSLPKSSLCRHSFTGKHKAIKLSFLGEGVRTYTTDNIYLATNPKPISETQRENHM
ncbi:uncharacterized protein LOC127254484 [Andrographis paniculata]|uniref:uncharacterized protein LOC127254484 n=1 Tax=Andrographis paniculata TaxID=175694 RepID=UPI0021E93CBB|nr:uncharacterized protein LOC127254484 [Andrographis paniculata]